MERTHARATVPTSGIGLAEREMRKRACGRGGGADKWDTPHREREGERARARAGKKWAD